MFCGAGALARDRAPLPSERSEDCHPERSEGTLSPPQSFTAVMSSEGALFAPPAARPSAARTVIPNAVREPYSHHNPSPLSSRARALSLRRRLPVRTSARTVIPSAVREPYPHHNPSPLSSRARARFAPESRDLAFTPESSKNSSSPRFPQIPANYLIPRQK